LSFVETTGAGLKGEFVGHTVPKVQALILQAMNGVLFIDEAYGINSGYGDTYGREAITELLKNMEGPIAASELVVVFAGYESDMNNLLATNEGLKSRFPYRINIEKLTVEDQVELCSRFAKTLGNKSLYSQGFTLAKGVDAQLAQYFQNQHDMGKPLNGRELKQFVTDGIDRNEGRDQFLSEGDFNLQNLMGQLLPPKVSRRNELDDEIRLWSVADMIEYFKSQNITISENSKQIFEEQEIDGRIMLLPETGQFFIEKNIPFGTFHIFLLFLKQLS